MKMTAGCPTCGYNSTPPESVKLTDAELMNQRIRNYFSMNSSNAWWISQPEYICSQLKEDGISPVSILDVGCGDGRWVSGILKNWPETRYSGIDPIKEHIEDNQKRMPEFQWIVGKVQELVKTLNAKHTFDLILLSGTLQEKGRIVEALPIIDAVQELASRWIIVLLDMNVAWDCTNFFLTIPGYYPPRELPVLDVYRGPEQDSRVWIFEKTNP